MSISAFEIFKIGIGPSSSHTVGPMRAAKEFLQHVPLFRCEKIVIELFGSLALTGVGHGTDGAILAGLAGYDPENVPPEEIPKLLHAAKKNEGLTLLQQKHIAFDYLLDLQWRKKETLPHHSNAMRFSAFDAHDDLLAQEIYYSIGGGFIATEANIHETTASQQQPPYPFQTAAELFELCRTHKLTIAELMLANEKAWRPEAEIRAGLLKIARVMFECIERGFHSTEPTLPGGLNVKRRAPGLYQKLLHNKDTSLWPTVYAMAVNEENAAGGRVVTAPTNGAAGIIPAVLKYFQQFHAGQDDQFIDFLLTAAAIAMLYKFGASISGAEVGCQGEVGVACSMAAGALTAVLGGTLAQVENAAEMAMEHHLGMTCDPIAGLVQIPCIERNGVGAEKAIKLTQLALMEDGLHKKVSLDKVIKTMLKTGKDMMTIYKETSLGGLAANVPEC
jgi:L-serine dehydratase